VEIGSFDSASIEMHINIVMGFLFVFVFLSRPFFGLSHLTALIQMIEIMQISRVE